MESEVQRCKTTYNEALQNLEKISDEIHKLREDQKLNECHDEVRNNLRSADLTVNSIFISRHHPRSLRIKHICVTKTVCLTTTNL